jgi:diguanylate cyclase (GGDEF)-like protein/PAS domain S-box-containing protein
MDAGGRPDALLPDLPGALCRAVLEHSRDFVCVFGSDGTILQTNARTLEFLGHHPADLAGKNVADFLHPEDLARAMTAIGVAVEHRPNLAPAAFRLRHANGTWVRMEVNGNALAPEFPDLVAITGRVSHDADLYSNVLEAMIAGESMATVMTTVPEFTIWRTDDTICTVTWTEGEARCTTEQRLPPLLTGLATPVDGRSPWDEAIESGEERLHADLSTLPESIKATATAHGLLGLWVIPVPDPSGVDAACISIWSAAESAPVLLSEYSARIAEQLVTVILRWRHQQQQLERAARNDGLTGLINRNAFFDELAGPPSVGGRDAVLYIDLDGFKPINDRFGHVAGDRVLTELADRLRSAVRPTDLVGRLGGDEFAVLVRRCTSDEVQAVAHRVRERLGASIDVEGYPIRLSASVGVAMGEGGEPLLEAADRAQIDAKKGGGNRVRWAVDE